MVKNLIVHVVAAAGLFAGALVGMLAATGRLNHEGTRGIPLVASFFPPPEEGVDPRAHGTRTQPAKGEPLLQKGRSVFEPETVAGGEDGARGTDEAVEAANGSDGAQPGQGGEPQGQAAPVAVTPRGQGPGGYFRFEGMPAGLSSDKINEYWRRAREAVEELQRRSAVLDLREDELRALEQDVAERQAELARQRTRIEEMQRALEARIQEFQSQVKLVRSDEVAGLRRNARTLASFESAKAAELVQEQWKTDAGQELVLKTLEVMEADAADAILAELPRGLIRDVLEKRLRVIRERSTGGK